MKLNWLLAKGRLCRKQRELEQALHGYVRDHHRFLIANHLSHIDFSMSNSSP